MANAVQEVSERVVAGETIEVFLPVRLVTLEAASLTSPGGSKPMRRCLEQQRTPPAEWVGEQRAALVHENNVCKRRAVEAEFDEAQRNKKRFDARRRSRERCARLKAETGFARGLSRSASAHAARTAICVESVRAIWETDMIAAASEAS